MFLWWGVRISIHALLAESDTGFYLTLEGHKISIHALLAESDHIISQRIGIKVNISIHALLAESDEIEECN